MRNIYIFLFLIVGRFAAFAARETVHDAALSARKLLKTESVLTLTSIFTQEVLPSLAGQPFGYPLSLAFLLMPV